MCHRSAAFQRSASAAARSASRSMLLLERFTFEVPVLFQLLDMAFETVGDLGEHH
jgi:hypothetical protein